VYEGANATGLLDLYIDGHQTTEVTFFGSNSSSFIQFNSDSKKSQVTLRYNPETYQNEMVIEGSISVNKLTVSTNYGTISTENVFLPLSHYWKIEYNQYNSSLKYSDRSSVVNATNQDVKIMPGCSVTIGENVSFLGKQIAVYSTGANIPTVINSSYFKKANGTDVANTAGVLCVKGSLSVSALGGYVQVDSPNATLYFGSGTVSSKELSETGIFSTKYVTNTLTSSGNVATSDTTSQSTGLTAGKTYTSIGKAWFKPFATITLDPNGGSAGTASIVLPVDKVMGVTNQTDLLNASKPTWTGHTFVGWYLDEACQTPYSASGVKYDTTLYAKWSLDATVTFVTNGGTSVPTVLVAITDTGISEADLEKIKNTISTKSNHILKAWHVDEGLTEEVTAEWFAGKGSAITLYAEWEEVETYTVELRIEDEDLAGRTDLFNIDHVEASMGTVISLPKASNIDDIITEKKYFIGWALSADGDVVTDIMIDNLTKVDTDSEGKNVYALYAKWGTKVTVTFNASEYSDLIDLLGSKVVDNGIESIYLKPGASYNVASFNNYQYLSNANNLLDYQQYFDGTWILPDGISIIDNVLTVDDSVADDTQITIKPYWKTKYTVTLTASGVSSFSLSIANGSDSKTKNGEYHVIPNTQINLTASGTGGLFSGKTVTIKINDKDNTSSSASAGAFYQTGTATIDNYQVSQTGITITMTCS